MRRILVIVLLFMVAFTGCLDEAQNIGNSDGSKTVAVLHTSSEVNQKLQELRTFQQNLTREQQAGNITVEEARQRYQERVNTTRSEVRQLRNQSRDDLATTIEDNPSLELQDRNGRLFLVKGSSDAIIQLLEEDNVQGVLPESEFQPRTPSGLAPTP